MKEPPKARFVPPPEIDEATLRAFRECQGPAQAFPFVPDSEPPKAEMGVWGGDEPRARLPADPSYLNPRGPDWREKQRRESELIAVLSVIVTAAVVGWVCWVLTS
jgi:hypothetical protein